MIIKPIASMAQIRDGCYRIIAVNREDIDLVNLHDSPGKMVSVEVEHREYSDDLESQISELLPGNCIRATIQSEDIYRPDSIWRFLEFNCFENTELHAVRVDELISQDLIFLGEAMEQGQSSPEVIEENGRKVGFKFGRLDQRGPVVHGPAVTTYKEIYKPLKKFDDPPYEIVSIVSNGVPMEVRYYFAEKGTNLSERIIESGEYLVGHSR